MGENRSRISIIVPFYNEGENVDIFYDAICNVFSKFSRLYFEVICVADGSYDETLEMLVLITQKDPRFRVVELSRNFGKEAALTAGIDLATGDAVIPIDADLQDPPELIVEMINEWSKGAEVVIAKRVDRYSDSFLKRKTAEIFYRFHNQLSTIQIPENVGDFRLKASLVSVQLLLNYGYTLVDSGHWSHLFIRYLLFQEL